MYQQRAKHCQLILHIGKVVITKAVLFLGGIGLLINIFVPSSYIVSLALGGFLVVIASYGGICTIVFSNMGWSENIVIDALFNQLSIVIAALGFLAGLLYMGFLILGEMEFPLLLILSISGLIISVSQVMAGRYLFSSQKPTEQ